MSKRFPKRTVRLLRRGELLLVSYMERGDFPFIDINNGKEYIGFDFNGTRSARALGRELIRWADAVERNRKAPKEAK